jgi:hypothetical protein
MSEIITESRRAVSGWHVGKNVPGYLPESDVTHTETWREALEALRDEIDRDADGLFDFLPQEHLEEYDGAMAEIREILKGKDEEEGDGMYYHLPSSSSDRDLGISYWVEPCTEAECQILAQEELEDRGDARMYRDAFGGEGE